jgi:hypothetical protein
VGLPAGVADEGLDDEQVELAGDGSGIPLTGMDTAGSSGSTSGAKDGVRNAGAATPQAATASANDIYEVSFTTQAGHGRGGSNSDSTSVKPAEDIAVIVHDAVRANVDESI